MFVGFVDRGVCIETICYIAGAGIAVADSDRERICDMGHDTYLKRCLRVEVVR